MLKKLFYLMVCAALFAGCHKDDDEEEVLTLDKHRFEVAAEGGTVSVKVTGNVDYTVTVPEAFRSWINEESAKVAGTHSFAVSENEELDGREGYIVFAGGTLKDTVYVVQTTKSFTETVSGVSFDMVYVKGGTFQMGATEDDEEAWDDEKPVHSVTLSGYYIGKHEVTQGLWKVVMGTSVEEQRDKANKEWSLYGVGDNYPMYYVCWDEAQEFVRKLSELTGKKYVLPTEAQWEYAARGGVKSKGYKYSGSNTIDNVAWYWGNSVEKYSASPVGTKSPNELGIYDMTGNVWEWCGDWFDSNYYANSPQTNPTGPASGSSRVYRGGSWNYHARNCRVSCRDFYGPDIRYSNLGFRVALAL